eukprot:1176844-Rhodomonas_salina.1
MCIRDSLKAGPSTIDVEAYNPDNDVTPWQDHPYLQDVYVRYRRQGDSLWIPAMKPDGTPASFGTATDAEGFTDMLQVDVSGWNDGVFELSLLADCGVQPGALGSYQSSTITGRVDRVSPRLWGTYAEPSNGKWEPGKAISARMTEDVDCRAPYTFKAHLVVEGKVKKKGVVWVAVDNEHLDLKCSGDTVEVAFSPYTTLYTLNNLQGEVVTVFLEDVRDVAGNFQEGSVSWSFKINQYQEEDLAVHTSLYFKDLSISLYEADPQAFQAAVINEVCVVGNCQKAAPTIESIRAGSIWVDMALSDGAEGIQMAEALYVKMGNKTVPTMLPEEMLLSGGRVQTLTFTLRTRADSPLELASGNSVTAPGDDKNAGGSSVVSLVTLGAVGFLCVLGLALFVYIRSVRSRLDSQPSQQQIRIVE